MKTKQLINSMYLFLVSIWILLMLMGYISWQILYKITLPPIAQTSPIHTFLSSIAVVLNTLPIAVWLVLGGLIMGWISSRLTFRVIDSYIKKQFDSLMEEED